MRGPIFGALALCFMLAACGSEAGPHSAATATDQATGQAAPSVVAEATAAASSGDEASWRAEIEAWAQQEIAGQQLGLSPEMTDIFFGDFSGDSVQDALLYAEARGPTSITIISALFRNDGGHMRFVRRVEDVFGSEPENVQFTQGRVTLTTTFMDGPDAGQSRNWTIRAP